MASKRQIEANRRNAKKSTGPKSESGRNRASQNAHRHGLSVGHDTHLERGVESLSVIIQSDVSGGQADSLSRITAEAHLLLIQVRRARLAALTDLRTEGPTSKMLWRIANLGRYERAARAKRSKASRSLKSV